MDEEMITERRRRAPSLWKRFVGNRAADRMRLLELAVVVVLTIAGTLGVVAWAGREERADHLVDALCQMADAFRDDEVQDQLVVSELSDMRRLLASGVAAVIDEEQVDELEALIDAQAKAAQRSADRPPLPRSIAEVCAERSD